MDHVVSVKMENHTEKKLFKSVCEKCGGRGHDEDKCASRIKIETVKDDYMNPSTIDSLEHCG